MSGSSRQGLNQSVRTEPVNHCSRSDVSYHEINNPVQGREPLSLRWYLDSQSGQQEGGDQTSHVTIVLSSDHLGLLEIFEG